MKKIFLILICSTYVCILASCNQKAGEDSTGGIVYVNADSLLTKYTFSVDQNKQFKAVQDSFQGILQQRESALQGTYMNYQKSMGSMSENQRKKTEGDLSDQQQQLQQMNEFFQQQLAQRQHDLTDQLGKKVQGFLKDYAPKHHYKMVMLYSALLNGGSVLYGDPSLDITTNFIKDINAAYAKK